MQASSVTGTSCDVRLRRPTIRQHIIHDAGCYGVVGVQGQVFHVHSHCETVSDELRQYSCCHHYRTEAIRRDAQPEDRRARGDTMVRGQAQQQPAADGRPLEY